MLSVRIDEVIQSGKFNFKCRVCATKCIFPGGGALLIYGFGAEGKLHRTVVVDVETGARLHDCKVVRVWMCSGFGCDFSSGQVPTRRDRPWTRCPNCGEQLEQHEMPAEAFPVVPS